MKLISNLYKSIIPAGVYESSSIKIAEAAKVIENTQRDLNIALVNELSIIFNGVSIDTQKVWRHLQQNGILFHINRLSWWALYWC